MLLKGKGQKKHSIFRSLQEPRRIRYLRCTLILFMLVEGDLMYCKFCPRCSRYPCYTLDLLTFEMSLKVQLLVKCDGYNGNSGEQTVL